LLEGQTASSVAAMARVFWRATPAAGLRRKNLLIERYFAGAIFLN
jgi:hypothetical protein